MCSFPSGECKWRYRVRCVHNIYRFPKLNTRSAGLQTTGSSSSGCSSSPGQVYARAGTYNGAYGIMYSWYMPKDSPSNGLGHRHDWENIVVWLSSASTTATVRGVAISAHGEYQKETSPPFSGTRPKIGYRSIWPVNHQLISTSDQGGSQPLIAWESMTPAARSAIANTVCVFYLGFPNILMCTNNHGRILDPRPQALGITTFKIPSLRHTFRLFHAESSFPD